MNKVLLSCLFCLLQVSLFAQETKINFTTLSYDNAFKLAKKENKKVLLYFHFEGCVYCREMEKNVFVEPNVAAFFNNNFISFSVDIKEEKGKEVSKIHNIDYGPCFIFLDADKNKLLTKGSFYTPQQFIELGESVLQPKQTLHYIKTQYEKGNKSPEILKAYNYHLKDQMIYDSLLIQEYLSSQTKTQLGQEDNIKFILDFLWDGPKLNLDFYSASFQILIKQREKVSNIISPDQEESQLIWALINHANKAISDGNEQLLYDCNKLLTEFDNKNEYYYFENKSKGSTLGYKFYGKGLVLRNRINFYVRVKKSKEHDKQKQEFIQSIWDNDDALNSFAWTSYLKVNENERLADAIKCVTRAIVLNNNYANNDTYAALLYKIGKKNEALKQAEKTIAIAKSNGEDYTETNKLIEKIKELN